MTILEVREEIVKGFDYANENNFVDPVIRLYISSDNDITIWEEKGYFYYSIGNCRYGKLDELMDDLCKEIEYNGFYVANVEIE